MLGLKKAKFCQEIIKRDLKISWQFPTGTRSEAIDDEVADLLRRSGMVNMGYAPESGSEITRKYIKKKMRTDNLLKSIDNSVQKGLKVTLFLVLGFPHDDMTSILENRPFLKEVRDKGTTDLAIGFFIALPGTELFDSLFDAGKVRLDRDYFAHILQGSSLIPTVSYSPTLSRLTLAYWKIRLSLEFYGSGKEKTSRIALAGSLKRGLKGIFKGEHESRLETAIRNGMLSAVDSVKVLFKPRWMSKKQEAAMIIDWNDIYRNIRRDKLNNGTVWEVPADTRQLHETSIVRKIQHEHNTPHRVTAPIR